MVFSSSEDHVCGLTNTTDVILQGCGVNPAQTHYTKPGMACIAAGQHTGVATLLSPETNVDPRTLQYVWCSGEKGRVGLFVLNNFVVVSKIFCNYVPFRMKISHTAQFKICRVLAH